MAYDYYDRIQDQAREDIRRDQLRQDQLRQDHRREDIRRDQLRQDHRREDIRRDQLRQEDERREEDERDQERFRSVFRLQQQTPSWPQEAAGRPSPSVAPVGNSGAGSPNSLAAKVVKTGLRSAGLVWLATRKEDDQIKS